MGPFPRPCLRSLALLLCITVFRPSAAALSSITSDQPLAGNQTLVSKEGRFVLGLFSPGESGTHHYVGIWYGKVSQQTVVWVANREAPILDPSSFVLRISSDGNLVIVSGDDNSTAAPVLWSTQRIESVASSNSSTVAELLDSGNLVLRDGGSKNSSSAVLWQSFDHPTNTWLPGGKLGRSKATGVSQLLTSWTDSEDPAPGFYSLEVDPNGTSQYLIVWNRTRSYWSSGLWNGQIFSGVPEMTKAYIYTFEYVSNDRENYFTYSVKNDSIITRLFLDISGQIRQQTWLEENQQWFPFWSQPRTQCDVYSFCGSFSSCDERQPHCSCLKGFRPSSPERRSLGDYSAGCVRKTPLLCHSTSGNNDNSSSSSTSSDGDNDGSQDDEFYEMHDVKLSDGNPRTIADVNEAQCKSGCLQDCSCVAYSYESGCSLWGGRLLNLQQVSGQSSGGVTLHLRLAASDLPEPEGKRKRAPVGVIVGGAAAGCLLLGVVAGVLLWSRRKKGLQNLKVVDGTLLAFKYNDLRQVTKNFSTRLGRGGFGSVFKGKLPDSSEIAVKRLESVGQGEKQFRTEVSTIGSTQHVNLVRLRGFCSEGARRLLVYDYMPGGSLDALLFRGGDRRAPAALGWKTRYDIMLGVARGLAYLHEECRECIIHCDVKPENILLDAGSVPKVADFGLAKLVGRDFSRVLTTMRGTRGYLAPEWISGVAVTAKVDVYSYGMMLFEIVRGRRNSEQVEEGSRRSSAFFPAWAASKMVEGDVRCLSDPRLEEGDVVAEQLERVCRTACWCVQDDEAARPFMGQVVQILEGVVDVNAPPIPSWLRNLLESPEQMAFFSDASSGPRSSRTSGDNSVRGSRIEEAGTHRSSP